MFWINCCFAGMFWDSNLGFTRSGSGLSNRESCGITFFCLGFSVFEDDCCPLILVVCCNGILNSGWSSKKFSDELSVLALLISCFALSKWLVYVFFIGGCNKFYCCFGIGIWAVSFINGSLNSSYCNYFLFARGFAVFDYAYT